MRAAAVAAAAVAAAAAAAAAEAAAAAAAGTATNALDGAHLQCKVFCGPRPRPRIVQHLKLVKYLLHLHVAIAKQQCHCSNVIVLRSNSGARCAAVGWGHLPRDTCYRPTRPCNASRSVHSPSVVVGPASVALQLPATRSSSHPACLASCPAAWAQRPSAQSPHPSASLRAPPHTHTTNTPYAPAPAAGWRRTAPCCPARAPTAR